MKKFIKKVKFVVWKNYIWTVRIELYAYREILMRKPAMEVKTG